MKHGFSRGKKMPKLVVDEIINDLRNGEKSNWGWAIGVLLVSGNEDIKKYLKQVLLDEKRFRAKAVLSILNTTKVSTSDKNHLFEIIEEERGNEFSITVKFRGEKVFRNSANYGKFEPSETIGMVRNKVLKRIVTHFCGK